LKNSFKCPKCGNTDIRGPHRIAEQGSVAVDLPGLRTATFDSFTCAKCGYTELYTDFKGLDNIKKDGRKFYEIESYKEKFGYNKKYTAKPALNCFNCKASLTKEDVFCPNCGQRVK
jgi:predicted nucleic-acid-binding Zn-ribbon protein